MGPKTFSKLAGAKRKAVANAKHGSDVRAKKAKTSTGKQRVTFDNDDVKSDSDSGDDADSVDGGAEVETKSAKFEPKGKKPNGDATTGTQTSREAHAKQKQLAAERKAAKPLADEVQRTKKLWEKLRRKSHVPKEERQQLVDELYSIITGKVKDFVLKHDAVRAVQTAIKYSTPAQRKQIAKELQGTYAQLAESRYAKFLIGKLLVQNDDEIRDIIVPEFYGKVRKLINHPEASWILDDIYRGVATKDQKARLLREWYGPEFALFMVDRNVEATADLNKILAEEPSKRATALKYCFDMVNGLIQKKLTGFTMLHDAMLQYFLNLKPGSDELKEFTETIKEDEGGDLLKNMAFTKSGARLVCLLLAHGNAKDRKQIIKTFKDTFQLMSGDPNGHMIILAAYDLIDDTVLTSKTIFPELIGKGDGNEAGNLVFLANDLNARTTILYLFEGRSKSLFPTSHANDLAILDEIHEIRKTTSKKEPEIRRKELVAAISSQLLAVVAASPNDLVSTSFGCQFAAEVLLSTVGDKSAALAAIASTAGGDPSASTEEEIYPPPLPHISLTPHGGKMFKTLIAGGRFDKATGELKRVDPPLNFVDILYPIIEEHVVQWATGPSSFTVLALLEAPGFASKDKLTKALKENKKVLKKAATEETAAQKEKTEVDAVEKEGGAKKRKSKSKDKDEQPKPKGNRGTKLVLEKLGA
ncbi:Armadillo-type fold [Rhypophila decipiens]